MWSRWKSIGLADRLTPAVLTETLDGGQAFRWHSTGDGIWTGAWGNFIARLRVAPDGEVEWSAPGPGAGRTEPALRHYLDADRAARTLADTLPWRSDPHLAVAVGRNPGLRILRQPFGETLLCFLCSSAKQIVQIKQMAAALASSHGRPILGSDSKGVPPHLSHRLPTWEELAELPESALRACKLGFRARFVAQTAQYLRAHPGWLEETEGMPYPEARQRLCLLPGVGDKIADCVLLFGANRLEAFPVDVWILAAMSRRYALAGWKSAQVAQFGRIHFGALAGLAQQYLFAWERKNS